MKNLISKGFNEIFLNEISNFDIRKYAYEVFFNCDSKRFSKIAHFYGIQNGNNSLNYMYNTFHSWKSGSVNPNYSSSYNIVKSTSSTFTNEEKFVEAYTQLAKHIKNSFFQKIQLSEINETFEKIIEKIETFSLEKSSTYSHSIYINNELEEYQLYVKLIFKYYTKTIFENINKDIFLFKKIYNDINTSFLSVSFHTYLFNIEIDISNVVNKKNDINQSFNFNSEITFEDLIKNQFVDLSLEQIAQISKANEITKIDSFLSEIEIQKLIKHKEEIQNSKKGGTLKLNLKSNSGILNISLRIISPYEKLIIISKLLLFIISICTLSYYCLIYTTSYFIFTVGLIILYNLITSEASDILNLIKDIFKTKNNGR